MLLFEEDKIKSLEFNMTELKNIQLEDLSYKMCLVIEGIEYGFAASLNSETKKIVANIPPINEFVKVDMSNKDYLIRLEVTGIDKKFYDSPWESNFKVKMNPKIEMSLKEDIDVSNGPEMKAVLSEDTDVNIKLDRHIDDSFVTESFKRSSSKKYKATVVNEKVDISHISDVVKLPNWFLKDQGE